MNVVISVLIRHFLAAVGAAGFVSGDEVKAIAGALTTLAMIGWSLWQKREAIRAERAR
jgi:hypothetical protein